MDSWGRAVEEFEGDVGEPASGGSFLGAARLWQGNSVKDLVRDAVDSACVNRRSVA